MKARGRVDCIAPETILTDGNLERIPPDPRARLALEHLLRRLGLPEGVADAARSLAPDASGWITAVVLDVAGGGVIA